ncbi:MAG: hypothetical protein IM585_02250 [Pseudanabaena sp. M135S2SP2A07QC]|jgi:hypothetical protein|nr:hypothetical protein [Pseudanabaena sp. M179S2SP2A07QC]MCA6532661.1 hypothetical protein [Pseudanabaena sp. M176S2SP2A07QC]MCA6539861.1 hypothetical protein [Pseudanabaena sp. M037S2SP2A07QC]MCA6547423.1 hypothetical protein [Pseudanabaena sp. M152S2SP2A07QC]MCA6550849.1 hypothetical protein [Pseudanabaena sp. M135S2SP2A07QC]MCA6555409.1 hypothetical protein [Pseudanabaena sp. M114S2SP2A07QC]MCA6559880.1 hypothetical protein [Pseudanabaena sp. M079S1SP2A07QC]MCA6563028.1 hypothetical prot
MSSIQLNLVIMPRFLSKLHCNNSDHPTPPPKPDRLFSTTSNSDRPLLKANPDRVSMLLFYNEIGYIVQCNDTK